ncbi:MAG: DUF3783 domain-containing protein [Ruminococcus sp.]|nr:DUF3783 domain-containing protein [Ruminococcus sp.]
MKARVQRPKPLLMFYGKNDEKISRISNLCERFGFSFRNVSSEEANQTVGFLAGFNGFPGNNEKAENPPENECIVFSSVERETLDRFLTEMRNNELRVTLKAMITPHNQKWKLCDLITELEREHKTMHNL